MQEISKSSKFKVSESIAAQYTIVLVLAGVLYVFSCAPGILWQDSGLLVYRILHNDIEGNLGLAVAHPLYVMIGIVVKYIPVGQLAYRINLISAFFGAVTIANLFLLLRLWLGRSSSAVIGAITLAVSWAFWGHSVITEVYSLYIAQMLGELIVLLQYMRTRRKGYLYLLGLFNGLAIANHMWGSLALGCYGVFFIVLLVRKELRLKHLCIIVLLWVLGASPYEYLIVKNIVLSGDVLGTLASAAFGNMWQDRVLNSSISMKVVLENIIFILLNFPTPNFLFFFVGLRALPKTSHRSFAWIIFAMMILYFVFAFRYTVPDRHVFFLPFYCLAAVLMGLGADVFLRTGNRKRLLAAMAVFALLPVAVYCVTPTLAKRSYKSLGQRRQLPYRDEYKYFLQPWKGGYRGAERFANEALDGVEDGAMIYADTTTVHALLYLQQVNGKRYDVRIVSSYDKSKDALALNKDTVSDLMASSALYVVSPLKGYCPAFLFEGYDFVRSGVLWRVVEKNQKDKI